MSLKQHNKKWRLEIKNEEWEFPSQKAMRETLDKVIELKEKYGDLKQNGGE